MSQYDQRLVWINSKECVFRINRDLRFSKDKSPYKDHFGAAIWPWGKRSPFSDYYIHIKPGNNSIVWWGIYRPDADVLSAIRKWLSIEWDKYEKIILEKKFSETFWWIRWETIKTTPKWFDKDNPWIDHIKRKDYYVMKEFKDEEVLSKEFFDNVIQTLQTLLPLNNFLNSHIQKIFE